MKGGFCMIKHVSKVISTLFVAVCLVAGGLYIMPEPANATSTADACLHYTNHEYEVCTAYIANSSLAVLLPYYAYANSTNSSTAGYVSYRLDQRYTGQANMLIRNRVALWPNGSHDVALPYISINSVTSSVAANTATLHTVETWRVTDERGHVIFQEANRAHTITMQRVPSYVLHKWVVTNIQ